MLRQSIALGVVLCSLTLPAASQNGHYASGSDFIGWPASTPSGLTKIAGVDFTPDDIDDAIALQNGSLYLIHAPAMFPRWGLIASGVTDFVVVVHNGTPGAIYSDANGLRFVSWNENAPVVTPIVTDAALANLTLLTAAVDQLGDTTIAGKFGADAIRRGQWTAAGGWSALAPLKMAATSLVVFNYTTTVAGMELGVLRNAALAIYAQNGNALAVPTLPATAAHAIYRNPGGGHGGKDSLLYVAQSTLPPSASFESFQEVFWEGASTPFETGPWMLGAMTPARPFLSGAPGVIVQATSATTTDVFRFQDLGAAPETQTLALWGSTLEHENYWHIPVTSSEPGFPVPVVDGMLACADFDADGLDDVLVASADRRHSYFFPAWDDPERYNAISGIQRFTPYAIAGPVGIGVVCDVAALPRGFTAPANAVQVIAWTREGANGLAPFIAPTPADIQYGFPDGEGSASVTLNVPYDEQNSSPAETLCYIQVRCLLVENPAITPPVILRRGSPVNFVSVLDEETVGNPLLCSLFGLEPDQYTGENVIINGCGGIGGVVLNGYSRRSVIASFPPGTGSPTVY